MFKDINERRINDCSNTVKKRFQAGEIPKAGQTKEGKTSRENAENLILSQGEV